MAKLFASSCLSSFGDELVCHPHCFTDDPPRSPGESILASELWGVGEGKKFHESYLDEHERRENTHREEVKFEARKIVLKQKLWRRATEISNKHEREKKSRRRRRTEKQSLRLSILIVSEKETFAFTPQLLSPVSVFFMSHGNVIDVVCHGWRGKRGAHNCAWYEINIDSSSAMPFAWQALRC